VQFEFRRYCRPFVQPLQTNHGQWDQREGVILCLNDGERWGEIAPLEWFGSESLEQAIAFCRSVPISISADILSQIPASLPACRFGFESLFASDSESLEAHFQVEKICGLLPTGMMALEAWRSLYAQGTRTFKWKIGVAPVAEELEIFTALIQSFPLDIHLRLDANGGLTEDTAHQWLRYCDPFGVEFLEQPLPPNRFELMLNMSQQYKTPIALDESVATIEHLHTCYQKGWRGIFVIKAAITGSPAQLRSLCEQHPVDIVWSSVFETPIAQTYLKNHLIPSIPTIKDRAIGFGVNHWFNDGWEQMSFEEIWQSL
jgi:o-succinylbenzoate synthase